MHLLHFQWCSHKEKFFISEGNIELKRILLKLTEYLLVDRYSLHHQQPQRQSQLQHFQELLR